MAALLTRPGSAHRIAAVTAWHARTYRRVWGTTIATAILNPVFFLLSIGLLLGTLVDAAGADLDGLTYLEFVAPGLLAAAAMQTGTSDATYPVMAGVKWLRTYHAVVATPVGASELVLGTVAFAAMRTLAASSIFATIAWIGGAFSSPFAALSPLAALLCGLAFMTPVAAFCASLEEDSLIPALMRFGIVPMFLFAGTFFPVEQLPDGLEPVAWVTPLWHGVTLCRDLTTGRVELASALGHVAYLLTVILVGLVAAAIVFRRRLLS